MKPLALLAFFLMTTTAFGSDYGCVLAEETASKKYETPISIPLDAMGSGAYELSRSAGGLTSGKIQLCSSRGLWTLLDPSTSRPVSAMFGATEGSFSRVQIIPASETNDWLMMDCVRGEYVQSALKPTGFSCKLIEKAGSAAPVESPFEILPAQSGHDITNLPEAKLAPLGGWVMGYQGSFVTFVQNKNTFAGVTTVASWDQPISLSWYPDSSPIRVTVSCEPKFE